MAQSKNIKLLALFRFLSNINFAAPIVIIFFQNITHSYTLATSVISIVLISSAIFEIPTGVFSDYIGRRKTMVLGVTSMLIALVIFGIAKDYWVLVIGAIFNGLSKSFYSGNDEAYLYETLEQDQLQNKYHHFAGRLEAVIGVGSVLTALSSGFIANVSFSLLIWFTLIPQTLSLFILIFLDDIKRGNRSNNIYTHFKEALLEFKHNANLRLLSLSSILGSGFGATAFEFQSALFNTFWPTWAIGIARSIQEFVSLVPIYFSGRIADWIGKTKIMLASNIWGWLMNILAVAFNSFISPLFIGLSGLLWGPGHFAKESLIQKEFTDKQRATMASLNSLASSILFGVFLFIMGMVADKIGPVKTLLVIQIFLLIPMYLTFKLYKNLRVKLQ